MKQSNKNIIRVCEPDITSREIKYVTDAIKTGQISGMAKYVGLFEKAFAKKTGVKYAISVNSGGSALFLALWGLGIRKGDEVIVPTFTMAATAFAVTQCGAKPVFVDGEPNGNIDVSQIESKITKRTKAIMPVHIYGHPCDMDEIKALAKKYKLFIVEDAAEAHGALYKNKIAGTMSDASCFSFYANKLVTTGEGGMIATNNKKLAEVFALLRNYYFSNHTRYLHKHLAWNMKLSSVLSALGLAQLERLNELVNKRRANAKYYTKGLSSLKNHLIFPTEKKGVRSVYWMYALVLKEEGKRDTLMRYLKKNNVESRAFFIPMHNQPLYKKYKNGSYPVSESLGRNGLYLPSSSHLSKKDKDRVISVIKEFFNK
ncbi:MAG: DegT/DnrJ/EryC1/StrS family aminotransferase [bacterium]|nr:DegT/DnrJ/EryC1/StrS family aminotransferase [bacterium]